MKEAIRKTQEILELSKDEELTNLDDLRPAINNLCVMYMPKRLTVEQVDALAFVMTTMFYDPESFLNPKS